MERFLCDRRASPRAGRGAVSFCQTHGLYTSRDDECPGCIIAALKAKVAELKSALENLLGVWDVAMPQEPNMAADEARELLQQGGEQR